MEEILKVNSIEQYNQLFGFETTHPLVGHVRFDHASQQKQYRMSMGFYALFLKETKGCVINYGKTTYDFDDQTIVCFAPGQTVGFTPITGKPAKSRGILFHPDFIRGTSLRQKIKKYTFFSYEANEALHLSEKERIVITNCLDIIHMELERPIDRHTQEIVTTNIELLLDYCLRFYERQFITRKKANKDILARFEELLDGYFASEKPQSYGTPSVAYFAEQLHLSANYFGDLIKKETGKSAQEYVQQKIMDTAKDMLADPKKSVSEIAYALGYQYPQYFSRAFKKVTGCTPNEYRSLS